VVCPTVVDMAAAAVMVVSVMLAGMV